MSDQLDPTQQPSVIPPTPPAQDTFTPAATGPTNPPPAPLTMPTPNMPPSDTQIPTTPPTSQAVNLSGATEEPAKETENNDVTSPEQVQKLTDQLMKDLGIEDAAPD